jgi:hypothetical protein
MTDMEKRWEGRLQNIKTEIGIVKRKFHTNNNNKNENVTKVIFIKIFSSAFNSLLILLLPMVNKWDIHKTFIKVIL